MKLMNILFAGIVASALSFNVSADEHKTETKTETKTTEHKTEKKVECKDAAGKTVPADKDGKCPAAK